MFSNTALKSITLHSAKALAGVAAFCAIATGTVGCNGDDFAVVGGAIAIVAGAIAIDDALDHGGYAQCHGGYRDQCESIYDRWGRLHTDCSRRVWDNCASRYSSNTFKLSSTSPLAMSVASTGVSKMAKKYNLPLESAEKLNAVLQHAASGKSEALTALGLSNAELARVASYQMPSDAALDQIASSLALSREMSRVLVQQLVDETRAQMADIASPVWVACQSTGKWKTDANGATCKSTSWSGCSPATGASMCAAL